EVKTLTISGKQVTLAVFRQLREEPLIAKDGTIGGTLWGTVNYHPDKCADDREHLHVVWQQGNELRRSSVQSPRDAFFGHPAAGWYVHARVLDGLRYQDPERAVQVFARRNSMDCARAWTRINGIRFHADVTDECGAAFETGNEKKLDVMRAQLAKAFPGGDASAAGFATELLAVASAYERSWQILSGLPQLFIAV
ncbi:hypothetical protein O3Q52_53880, partial [Streptomyces sp. ActVer]|uniref:hypothetical protein n=1 Tax=Streptomyces sp. ActVer TaxID=3014558 RepID=UPI0022B4F9B9